MTTTARGGRRPTLEDVAAHAGVSRALASIVIRGAAGASDATRERVLASAAALGYRPDPRARLLARRRSRLIVEGDRCSRSAIVRIEAPASSSRAIS